MKINELLSGRGFVKPPFAFVASDENAVEGVAGDLYLPIPFAAGCKITLDELPFYYNINYRAYAPGTKVKTFTMADYDAAADRLKQTAGVLDAWERGRRQQTPQERKGTMPAGEAGGRSARGQQRRPHAGSPDRPARCPAGAALRGARGDFRRRAHRLVPAGRVLRLRRAAQSGQGLGPQRRGGRQTDRPVGHALREIRPHRHQEPGEDGMSVGLRRRSVPGSGTTARCTSTPTGGTNTRSKPGRPTARWTGTTWKPPARESMSATR